MLTMLQKRIKEDPEFRKNYGFVSADIAYPIPKEPLSYQELNDRILEMMKKQVEKKGY